MGLYTNQGNIYVPKPDVLQDDGSLELQAKLDEEYEEYARQENRRLLREFVFQRMSTNQPQYLPVPSSRVCYIHTVVVPKLAID